MKFISYAQNFEDVLLWRALNYVENGFYIDVGAAWPDYHSVTKAFYERGWRGINIEPNPLFHERLSERRPHDRNLRLAAGEREGVLLLNVFGDTGLSTLDGATAGKHRDAGWNSTCQDVQVMPLAAIWERYVPSGQVVHFLKIDVEGFEAVVLRGNDWSRYRPWVVVIEATLPLSMEESHEIWEPMLVDADYRFAYADGLNRFYVASEHSELLSAFKYPPNDFDQFKLAAEVEADARATQAENSARRAEAEVELATKREGQAQTQLQQALEVAKQAQEIARQLELRAQIAESREADSWVEMRRTLQIAQDAQEMVKKIEARAAQVENERRQAEGKFQQAAEGEANAHLQAQQAVESARQARELAYQAEAVSSRLLNEIQAIYSSKSWRITLPLRKSMYFIRWVSGSTNGAAGKFVGLLKRVSRSSILNVMAFALKRPKLRATAVSWLRNFPQADQRLRQLARANGLTMSVPPQISGIVSKNTSSQEPEQSKRNDKKVLRSHRARRIFVEMKTTLELNKKKESV